MNKLQGKDQLVPNGQRNYIWVKRSLLDREIGQRQNLTEHEFVQDEYLRNLIIQENLGQMYQKDKLEKTNQG